MPETKVNSGIQWIDLRSEKPYAVQTENTGNTSVPNSSSGQTSVSRFSSLYSIRILFPGPIVDLRADYDSLPPVQVNRTRKPRHVHSLRLALCGALGQSLVCGTCLGNPSTVEPQTGPYEILQASLGSTVRTDSFLGRDPRLQGNDIHSLIKERMNIHFLDPWMTVVFSLAIKRSFNNGQG